MLYSLMGPGFIVLDIKKVFKTAQLHFKNKGTTRQGKAQMRPQCYTKKLQANK